MTGALNVFARWWSAIVACIGASGGDSSNASGPLKKETCAPQSTPGSVPPSIGQGRPHPDTHRERFLRHPSITSTDGAPRGDNTPGTAGRDKVANEARKVQETRPDIAPAFRAHDFTSPSYRPNPPRRPPRPPSILLPAVIITPCTPEGMSHPNFEAIIATPESPLDKTITAYRIACGVAACGSAEANAQSYTTSMMKDEYPNIHRDPPPTYGRISGTDPPHKGTQDAVDTGQTIIQTPSRMEARRNRTTGRIFVSSKLRSFIVTDTLSSNLEASIAVTGSDSTISSSFGQHSDTPSWIFSLSLEQLAGFKPLTSTPTKHRFVQSGDEETMSPEMHMFRRSGDTSGTALSLRLPEEQEDLLPYPDVFDFELYYGLGSGRLSISRDGSSSIIRCSVDEKNVFLPRSSSAFSATRRYGYVVATHPRLSSDHIDDENVPLNISQHRDRIPSSQAGYHLPTFGRHSVSTPTHPDVGADRNDDSLPVFRPRTAVLGTPGSSTLASPGCESGRHVLLPIPLRGQIQHHPGRDSDSALEMTPATPTPTHSRTRSKLAQVQEPSFDTPSPLPGGPAKARAYTYTTTKTYAYGPPDIPLPPIVIVSSVSASDPSHLARNVYNGSMERDTWALSETPDTYDVVAEAEESNNTSPEILLSRLEATCNDFSRPMAKASWAMSVNTGQWQHE